MESEAVSDLGDLVKPTLAEVMARSPVLAPKVYRNGRNWLKPCQPGKYFVEKG
jgi:hypothetical protein